MKQDVLVPCMGKQHQEADCGGRGALQTTNALSPIGMAVAIAGKYMRYGDLVQSDSLSQIKSWVRPASLRPLVPPGFWVPAAEAACCHQAPQQDCALGIKFCTHANRTCLHNRGGAWHPCHCLHKPGELDRRACCPACQPSVLTAPG